VKTKEALKEVIKEKFSQLTGKELSLIKKVYDIVKSKKKTKSSSKKP